MDIEQLSTIVALIAALSVAAERLVEIVKNIIPPLREEVKDDVGNISPGWEGLRKAFLQVLAIGAGIVTVVLAGPAIEDILPGTGLLDSFWGTVALGVLASGGSAFWNKVVEYVGAVRDVKNADAEKLEKATVEQQRQQQLMAVAEARDQGLISEEAAQRRAQQLLP